MTRWSRWMLGACLLAQALLTQAATGLKFVSTPGDDIGQGQSLSLKSPAATVSASGDSRHVKVWVTAPDNQWSLDFAAPAHATLAPGDYPSAMRYPYQAPVFPGIDMSGNGRGCNQSLGWFRVLEYELDEQGAVQRLAIDFLQRCEMTGPPLYGAVRYQSKQPLAVPLRAAVAGPDSDAIEGDSVALDGSQSFSRKGKGQLGLRWTQLAGPPVNLDDPAQAEARFTAPAVPPDGAALRFRLDVTDSTDTTVSDDVVVMVNSAQSPRTEVRLSGDADDYITQGRSYLYRPSNAWMSFDLNYTRGVTVSLYGKGWWNITLNPADEQRMTKGHYPDAQRFPFQQAGHPGLIASGEGRDCNTVTGEFTVLQLRNGPNGSPQRMEASFEQHCEGATPAARGHLLLNAVPRAEVARQLAAVRAKHPRRGRN